ncbi:hypothetical protein GALL_543490 [mine drainage metagenome]|uniref:Uncharacterized protein n=1 Tax=mine drainage metagenome TaxID=410659 RepID=A0A1J5P0M5_9ZZZZ
MDKFPLPRLRVPPELLVTDPEMLKFPLPWVTLLLFVQLPPIVAVVLLVLNKTVVAELVRSPPTVNVPASIVFVPDPVS